MPRSPRSFFEEYGVIRDPEDRSEKIQRLLNGYSKEEEEELKRQFFRGAVASFGAGGLAEADFTFDNAEAETLVTAMTVEPNNTRKGLIDDLVGSLKTAGVWAKHDTIWIAAAHDAQAYPLNWKNPGTFDLTVGGGAPTFLTDRHIAVDGVDDWLDTNFNPATAGGLFTQNSASFWMWDRRNAADNASRAGWFDGSDGITLRSRDANGAATVRMNNNAGGIKTANGAVSDGSGLFGANRSASNAVQMYLNEAQLTTGSTASVAMNSANLRLGSITAAGFAAAEFAAAGIGGSMTETEWDALYTALLAYLTAVGAA